MAPASIKKDLFKKMVIKGSNTPKTIQTYVIPPTSAIAHTTIASEANTSPRSHKDVPISSLAHKDLTPNTSDHLNTGKSSNLTLDSSSQTAQALLNLKSDGSKSRRQSWPPNTSFTTSFQSKNYLPKESLSSSSSLPTNPPISIANPKSKMPSRSAQQSKQAELSQQKALYLNKDDLLIIMIMQDIYPLACNTTLQRLK